MAGLFKIVGPTIFGSVQCHPAVLRAGERGSVREARGVDVSFTISYLITHLYGEGHVECLGARARGILRQTRPTWYVSSTPPFLFGVSAVLPVWVPFGPG